MSDVGADELAKSAESLHRYKGRCQFTVMDVGEEASIADAPAEVSGSWSGLDVPVKNAAMLDSTWIKREVDISWLP